VVWSEREENRPEGKRTKTTGLYKVKDGHPTFWFFIPSMPVWPFFSRCTVHFPLTLCVAKVKPNTNGHFFLTPLSSSFNLKKLKDAAAR
jgi:hypothetical protein